MYSQEYWVLGTAEKSYAKELFGFSGEVLEHLIRSRGMTQGQLVEANASSSLMRFVTEWHVALCEVGIDRWSECLDRFLRSKGVVLTEQTSVENSNRLAELLGSILYDAYLSLEWAPMVIVEEFCKSQVFTVLCRPDVDGSISDPNLSRWFVGELLASAAVGSSAES
jgi:hypothetical protein